MVPDMWCNSRPMRGPHHPIAERPDLAHEQLNVTVRCRSCNGRRGDTYTDAERAEVLNAIGLRRERLQRFSACEQKLL